MGASGNVYGYNYSVETQSEGTWTPCDISLHGHYPHMNLFEGNTVQEVDVSDYWGPCGPGNTFLRNRVESEGIQVMHSGGWPAPFGITLVADLLAAIMVLLTGVTGLAVAVYSLGSIDERREAHGFHTLYHVLLMGVCGAFLTGDFFNLYVSFEIMLLASFVLLTLGSERGQLEGDFGFLDRAGVLAALQHQVLLGATGTGKGVCKTTHELAPVEHVYRQRALS